MNLTRFTAPDAAPAVESTEVDWLRGWREIITTSADGQEALVRIPLTDEEILHPEEGFVMPETTDHERISTDLRNMLLAWSLRHVEMTVYHDLIFAWDHPEVGNFTPDIAVVPNVRNPDANRGKFYVASEETRPCLVIEVVSPISRKGDRVTKVRDYARVGIREYVYIDVRRGKRGIVDEIAGFRLMGDSYAPIMIDEDGAIFCETVGLRIGIADGIVWAEDIETGEDLLSHVEAMQALLHAQEQAQMAEERAEVAEERAEAAEQRILAEIEARRASEVRLADLEAQLRALQAKNG